MPKRKQETDADRLRTLLSRACLSQRAFAREIDVSDRIVRYWLAGERPVPRLAMMAAEQLSRRQKFRP